MALKIKRHDYRPWMSLVGSKPGSSEIQSEDYDAVDERIMQVNTSHVCQVFWSSVLWC